jgi:hypothetical protein
MGNANTKAISVQAALSNAPFKLGFTDYAMGKGWHEKKRPADQWNYERGRMFAAWLTGQGIDPVSFPLKSGRWASRETIRHYFAARQDGSCF